jgi:hypothetical protein
MAYGHTGPRLDLPAWLTANGIDHRDEGRANTSGWRHYHVDCLFDENHRGKDAYFGINEDTGAICYHCSHTSCADRRWADARARVVELGGHRPAGFVGGGGNRYAMAGAPSYAGRADDRDDFDLEPISWAELAVKDLRPEWLCKNAAVKGQPLLVGGPSKTLKTSISIDLIVSLVTGTKFLNHFETPRVTPCLMVSAESGDWTIQNTVRRVLASKKHQDVQGVGDPPFYLSFRCPSISRPSHIETIRRTIRETGSEVFLLDPVYLSLMDASNADSAGNLFAVGSILRDLTEMIREAGATLILLHHFRKQQRTSRGFSDQSASLEDFSFSGFGEFARQWILIKRRTEFDQSSGVHELAIDIGGSVGHASKWSLDITEGRPDDVLTTDRQWSVVLSEYSRPQSREAADRARILDHMRSKGADSPSGVAEAVLGGSDNTRTLAAKRLLEALARDYLVEPIPQEEWPAVLAGGRARHHSTKHVYRAVVTGDVVNIFD